MSYVSMVSNIIPCPLVQFVNVESVWLSNLPPAMNPSPRAEEYAAPPFLKPVTGSPPGVGSLLHVNPFVSRAQVSDGRRSNLWDVPGTSQSVLSRKYPPYLYCG